MPVRAASHRCARFQLGSQAAGGQRVPLGRLARGLYRARLELRGSAGSLLGGAAELAFAVKAPRPRRAVALASVARAAPRAGMAGTGTPGYHLPGTPAPTAQIQEKVPGSGLLGDTKLSPWDPHDPKLIANPTTRQPPDISVEAKQASVDTSKVALDVFSQTQGQKCDNSGCQPQRLKYVRIDWGDGESTVVTGVGAEVFNGQIRSEPYHIYRDGGKKTITVTAVSGTWDDDQPPQPGDGRNVHSFDVEVQGNDEALENISQLGRDMQDNKALGWLGAANTYGGDKTLTPAGAARTGRGLAAAWLGGEALQQGAAIIKGWTSPNGTYSGGGKTIATPKANGSQAGSGARSPLLADPLERALDRVPRIRPARLPRIPSGRGLGGPAAAALTRLQANGLALLADARSWYLAARRARVALDAGREDVAGRDLAAARAAAGRLVRDLRGQAALRADAARRLAGTALGRARVRAPARVRVRLAEHRYLRAMGYPATGTLTLRFPASARRPSTLARVLGDPAALAGLRRAAARLAALARP